MKYPNSQSSISPFITTLSDIINNNDIRGQSTPYFKTRGQSILYLNTKKL